MTRNYTLTRSYLLQAENLHKRMALISQARSETWRNGWSTSQLEEKYKKANAEYHSIVEEIRGKIERIEDERLRIILKRRYLGFRSGAELTFVDPMADLMKEYQDGYAEGKNEGYREGYDSGYSEGYDCGYNRGENGLPYDEHEDEECDEDEEYDYDDDDEEYEDEWEDYE